MIILETNFFDLILKSPVWVLIFVVVLYLIVAIIALKTGREVSLLGFKVGQREAGISEKKNSKTTDMRNKSMADKGKILLEALAEIPPIKNKHIEIEINTKFNNFLSEVRKWGSSIVTISGNQNDDLLEDLYASAENSVFSTCIVKYIPAWTESFGKRLIAAHLKSKAKVKRIFIFEQKADISEEHIGIMKSQETNGIEVMVYVDGLDNSFCFPPDLSKDFTVIDNSIIGKTTEFGHGRTTEWVFDNEIEINRFDDYIRKLSKNSQSLKQLNLSAS